MSRAALLSLLFVAATLTGCNGIFGGIYDELPPDLMSDDGFSADPSHPDRLTLMVDAAAFDEWIYVSLNNRKIEKRHIPLACEGEWDGRSGITYNEVHGDVYTELSFTPTSAQAEPEEWDFAIHRFDVRTNRGAVARTELTTIAGIESIDPAALSFEPDVWSTHTVIVDLAEMMAYRIGYQNSYVNPVLSEWVTMDISTPPPTFSATGLVYVMRLAGGEMAAMRMRSYVNEHGRKGHLTIDIIYPLK